MSARSLNKVILIGNLTRDPELRYTPQGTAVCTFGVATNRQWMMESGEKREETEFHRIVAWNKLAELCSQLLTKGRKVYVEGRLQTRTWTGQDGRERTTTEIVIDDMIILDSRRLLEEPKATAVGEEIVPSSTPTVTADAPSPPSLAKTPKKKAKEDEEKNAEEKVTVVDTNSEKKPEGEEAKEDINPDDIPF